MSIWYCCSLVVLIQLGHGCLKHRLEKTVAQLLWCLLPGTVQFFNCRKHVVKCPSHSCWNCLLSNVCMLRWVVSIYLMTNRALNQNTWRILQNNLTWSHSFSVRAKSASFQCFLVFVSLILSSNINWLTNCSEQWVNTNENDSGWQLTSCLVFTLFSMASIEPQQTFISMSNCSGFSFFCSCISLNSCLHCKDDHA